MPRNVTRPAIYVRVFSRNANINSREILQITKTRNKIAANLNTVTVYDKQGIIT